MALNNTATRIIVALVFIPLLLGLSYYGGLPFLLFVSVIGVAAFSEFSKMSINKNSSPNNVLGIAAVLLIIVNAYKSFFDYASLMMLITVALLIYELFRNRNSAILNLGTTLLGILYIGIFSSSLIGIREFYSDAGLIYDQGGYIIIAVLVSIWVCDSAAFFLGTAFGKHKLFPRVSPNKSWEGAIAGFVFSVLTMIASKYIITEFLDWPAVISIGFIVGVFGQMGDLVESLIKRDAGVKDSSTVIPGHGGMFDRFDSLLFTAPLVYLYMVYFLR